MRDNTCKPIGIEDDEDVTFLLVYGGENLVQFMSNRWVKAVSQVLKGSFPQCVCHKMGETPDVMMVMNQWRRSEGMRYCMQDMMSVIFHHAHV